MKKIGGFTILELLIAMTIGILLIAGIFSSFVISKTTTTDLFLKNELNESAYLALNILNHDIELSGYWNHTANVNISSNRYVQFSGKAAERLNTLQDCFTNVESGSFPIDNKKIYDLFVQYRATKKSPSLFSCVESNSNLTDQSDIVEVRRLIASKTHIDKENRFFVRDALSGWVVYDWQEVDKNHQEIDDLNEYHRAIYYISTQNKTPALRMTYLANQFEDVELVQGIEKIHLLFWVDSSPIQDGIPDELLSSRDINPQYFLGSRVLAAELYLLARSIQPDLNYINKEVYLMGDIKYSIDSDHYHRLLLHKMIPISNHVMMRR